jgi:hypothetical protein
MLRGETASRADLRVLRARCVNQRENLARLRSLIEQAEAQVWESTWQ